MTFKAPTRLASGPIGPDSFVPTRRREKRDTTAAIEAALQFLIDNEIFPSIRKTVENGTGFSESTLNRKRYKPLLHAAKTRYDERHGTRNGGPREAASTDEPGAAANDDSEAEAPGERAASGAEVVPITAALDPETMLAIIKRLEAKVERQDAEIRRRDEQLYHALATARRHADRARRDRGRLREVVAELEAERSSAQPLAAREPRDWGDEGMYDDEDG